MGGKGRNRLPLPGFVSVTSRFLYVYLFALNCPGMYTVYGVVSDQEHSLEQAVLGRFFPTAVHRGSTLPAVVAGASEDVSYRL